ncbi:MAG TPA: hypothetical protein DD708_00495 [Deltaproteobacteria bacterium]|nr:hypothetical protein [Deltaproteobacteria bacterium]
MIHSCHSCESRNLSVMKKKTLLFLSIILIFLSAVGFSFSDFYQSLSNPNFTETPSVDAVVALTGGRGRLSQALKLFTESKATVLFISGARNRTSVQAIFSSEELEKIDISKIYLEQESTSTYQNALQTRNYIIQHSLGSAILVTSNYHMKRAFFIFRELFPDNVEIIPYAVDATSISWKVIFLEYLKYYWYRIILWRF